MGLLNKITSPITNLLGLTTPQSVQSEQQKFQQAQDEQLKKQREFQQKLVGQAADFRRDLPQFKAEQFRIQEDASKKRLAGSMGDIDKAASGRGLLYSGIREKGAADTLADFYAGQAEQKSAINQSAEDLARGMEEKSLGIGLSLQDQAQQAQDRQFQAAMDQRNARNKAMGGLIGAGARLVGGGLGAG